MNKELLEELIRKVIKEELGLTGDDNYKQMDKSGVGVVKLNQMKKRVKMDTGNPKDQVTTTDLFTLEESPRLGAGLMEMKETTFPWTLTYDEIDYII
ncbi:ethanolamine utilization protein EutQ, partial [Fusobacterium sp.]